MFVVVTDAYGNTHAFNRNYLETVKLHRAPNAAGKHIVDVRFDSGAVAYGEQTLDFETAALALDAFARLTQTVQA